MKKIFLVLMSLVVLGLADRRSESLAEPLEGGAPGATPALAVGDHSRAEAALLEALGKPIEIDEKDQPLIEVVARLGQRLNLNILVDEKALKDVGLSREEKITAQMKGVPLRSMLKHVLREIDCTYAIRDDALLITTPEEANARLSRVIYPVADLLHQSLPPLPGERAPALDRLIFECVAPTTWEEVGGAGSIDRVNETLVILNTQEVHEEILDFLAALRRSWASYDQWNGNQRPLPGVPPEGCWFAQADSPESWSATLAKPISLDFNEVPFDEAVAKLKQLVGREIQIDCRSLKDIGIDPKTAVRFTCRSMPLKSALVHLLKPLDLTFVIRDEILLITSPEEANSWLVLAIFPVGDLVASPVLVDLEAPRDKDLSAARLVDLISKTVGPTTWDTVGGPANVRFFAPARSLVISQTRDYVEEIDRLLDQLRKTLPIVAKGNPEQLGKEMVAAIHGPFLKRVVQPPGNELPQRDSIRFEGAFPMEAKSIARLITATLEPESWEKAPAKIEVLDDRLLVRHTRVMHAKISSLLEQIGTGSRCESQNPAPRPQFGPMGLGQKMERLTPVVAEGDAQGSQEGAKPEPPAILEKDRLVESILQKLEKRIDMSAEKTPLKDVVEFLARRANTPILIDDKAFTEARLDPELRVSRQLKQARIRSILEWLKFEYGLDWTIRGDVVLITSPEEAQSRLYTETYAVGDLLDSQEERVVLPTEPPRSNNSQEDQADELIDIITANLDPTSWDTVGGPGSICAVGQSLVVSQSFASHRKVANLLAQLRRSLRSREKWTGRDHSLPDLPTERGFREVDPQEAKWEKIRREKVSLDFQEVSLQEVARALSEKSGLPFAVAFRDSGEAELFSQQKVTCSCDDLPWENALELLLARWQVPLPRHPLRWMFFHETLLITSATDADTDLATWVFPVFDLVPERALPYDLQRARREELMADDLLDTITASLQPTTWDTVGGPNACAYYPCTGSIVISAPREVQLEVAALLEKLRRDLPAAPKRERAEIEKMLVTRVYGPYRDEPPPPEPKEEAKPPAPKEPAPRPAVPPAPPEGDPRAPALQPAGQGAANGMQGFGGVIGFAPRAGASGVRIRADEVAQSIRLLVEPETWEKPDSGARLILLTDRLIIRHEVRVHDKIEHLLRGLVNPSLR